MQVDPRGLRSGRRCASAIFLEASKITSGQNPCRGTFEAQVRPALRVNFFMEVRKITSGPNPCKGTLGAYVPTGVARQLFDGCEKITSGPNPRRGIFRAHARPASRIISAVGWRGCAYVFRACMGTQRKQIGFPIAVSQKSVRSPQLCACATAGQKIQLFYFPRLDNWTAAEINS
jgi:hypothetical protein